MLAWSGVAAPSLLSRPVLERLLDQILSRRPKLLLAAYAHQRPGVLSALLARVEELREAGIVAADMAAAPVPGKRSGTRQTSLFEVPDPTALPEDGDRWDHDLA